ncbi:trehalose-phosphatase [Methylosinus sp. Sm6]|uniref:trehalose-phosphatase n=1 Tax=Methylosinus sp. Sm6 TaxID=2866948 RepID=UPI001C994A60|nr:trehalose-phosphatase [Methylosinus sp. Sm6]MBY6241783.1 trehalose-phosphatase [Methylosinus sp. Sm6]
MLPDVREIGRSAVFLDLDGTLAELAERPEAVVVEPATIALLDALQESCGHALAIISGRDIAVVDRLLHPLVLPVAGVHGLQRRDAAGTLHSAAVEPVDIAPIIAALRAAVGEEPGLIVEAKTGAAALHYRLRPDCQKRCREIAETVVRGRNDIELLPGKMVYELRTEGADKGDVIEAFLKEAPFAGRRPVFAGDDSTDEVGFAIVNARGGVSIKVGACATTLARYRAPTLRELHQWLAELARVGREERVE